MPQLLSSQFVITLVVLAIGCAWSVSLSTEIFLSDGATKKSIRRGLGKIACLGMATFAAVSEWHFAIFTLLLVTALIHLFDLKATNSRWMTGRIACVTSPTVLILTVAASWLFQLQPAFSAILTLMSATFHVLNMRRRQTEFFQNFQLLRDRMATLEALQLRPVRLVNKSSPSGFRDNQEKAG